MKVFIWFIGLLKNDCQTNELNNYVRESLLKILTVYLGKQLRKLYFLILFPTDKTKILQKKIQESALQDLLLSLKFGPINDTALLRETIGLFIIPIMYPKG